MIYEMMKKRLSPVTVYREDAAYLEAELRAYASELERLYDELEGMFKERFISTAEGEGLKVYEELFGPERTGESIEKRREMLRLRMNLGEGDFTPAGINKALDSLGLSYVISEYPELERLTITATADYTEAEQAFIKREVEKIVPAHLDFQLTFNTLTWSQLDALDRSFTDMDNEDLSWGQIDNQT